MKGILNTKYFVSVSVALITFIVYLPSLQNDFVNWDDGKYIYENVFIRSLDARLLRSSFLEFHGIYWHPLAWLSHAVDYTIWGLNPLGHHLTNNILHALNASLVVSLMVLLIEVQRKSTVHDRRSSFFGSDSAILHAAAVTGLLFGIHPVHVESVAWVSERKDLLCAVFLLLSIIAYAKFAGSLPSNMYQGPSLSRMFKKHYLFALGYFVLALMSKPMAVSLPLVLLILDWYPMGRIQSLKTLGSALLEKLPFIAFSLASSILTLLAQKAGEGVTTTDLLPVATRLIVAAKSVITYLWKMAVPLNLVPVYPYPNPKDVSLLSFDYFFPVVLLLGITSLSIIFYRREKLWLAVWTFYLVTLLPVLGIVQVGIQSMADRFTYVPSIGPFLLVGLLSAVIFEKAAQIKFRSSMFKMTVGAIAIALPVSLSYVTIQQIHVWRNGFVLWNYVIEHEPGRIPVAHSNLADLYMSIGQTDAAIREYQKALKIKPDDPRTHNNLGIVCAMTGQSDLATEHFKIAISLKQDYPDALYNLGNLYASIGQTDLAIQEYQRALKIKPDDAEAHFNLGLIYLKAGMENLAQKELELGLSIDPDNVSARRLLGEMRRSWRD